MQNDSKCTAMICAMSAALVAANDGVLTTGHIVRLSECVSDAMSDPSDESGDVIRGPWPLKNSQ